MQKFEFVWPPENGTVLVLLRGFWTDADFDEYGTALRATAAKGRPSFDFIFDLSELMPQAQTIVAAHSSLMSEIADRGMRRAVIVGAPPLLTMQVKRAIGAISPFFASTVDHARQILIDD